MEDGSVTSIGGEGGSGFMRGVKVQGRSSISSEVRGKGKHVGPRTDGDGTQVTRALKGDEWLELVRGSQ